MILSNKSIVNNIQIKFSGRTIKQGHSHKFLGVSINIFLKLDKRDIGR